MDIDSTTYTINPNEWTVRGRWANDQVDFITQANSPTPSLPSTITDIQSDIVSTLNDPKTIDQARDKAFLKNVEDIMWADALIHSTSGSRDISSTDISTDRMMEDQQERHEYMRDNPAHDIMDLAENFGNRLDIDKFFSNISTEKIHESLANLSADTADDEDESDDDDDIEEKKYDESDDADDDDDIADLLSRELSTIQEKAGLLPMVDWLSQYSDKIITDDQSNIQQLKSELDKKTKDTIITAKTTVKRKRDNEEDENEPHWKRSKDTIVSTIIPTTKIIPTKKKSTVKRKRDSEEDESEPHLKKSKDSDPDIVTTKKIIKRKKKRKRDNKNDSEKPTKKRSKYIDSIRVPKHLQHKEEWVARNKQVEAIIDDDYEIPYTYNDDYDYYKGVLFDWRQSNDMILHDAFWTWFFTYHIMPMRRSHNKPAIIWTDERFSALSVMADNQDGYKQYRVFLAYRKALGAGLRRNLKYYIDLFLEI